MSESLQRIERAIAEIKSQRVAWLLEKPSVPKPTGDNLADYTQALRREWKWYQDQRERLVAARNALSAMIEDCDLSMDEAVADAERVKEVERELEALER